MPFPFCKSRLGFQETSQLCVHHKTSHPPHLRFIMPLRSQYLLNMIFLNTQSPFLLHLLSTRGKKPLLFYLIHLQRYQFSQQNPSLLCELFSKDCVETDLFGFQNKATINSTQLKVPDAFKLFPDDWHQDQLPDVPVPSHDLSQSFCWITGLCILTSPSSRRLLILIYAKSSAQEVGSFGARISLLYQIES